MQAQTWGEMPCLFLMRILVLLLTEPVNKTETCNSVILACAAEFVRQDIFPSNPFTRSFDDNCQKKFVSHLLLVLHSVYGAGGPKYQGPKSWVLKTRRTFWVNRKIAIYRSDIVQYKKHLFLSIYIGLMLHAQTWKSGGHAVPSWS